MIWKVYSDHHIKSRVTGKIWITCNVWNLPAGGGVVPWIHPLFFSFNLHLFSSLPPPFMFVLMPVRCVTSSIKTVRGCCWFMTSASGRVLTPWIAGLGRWSRKWALRPIWTASCLSSVPTRSGSHTLNEQQQAPTVRCIGFKVVQLSVAAAFHKLNSSSACYDSDLTSC